VTGILRNNPNHLFGLVVIIVIHKVSTIVGALSQILDARRYDTQSFHFEPTVLKKEFSDIGVRYGVLFCNAWRGTPPIPNAANVYSEGMLEKKHTYEALLYLFEIA
jgi:hypothetical protein